MVAKWLLLAFCLQILVASGEGSVEFQDGVTSCEWF